MSKASANQDILKALNWLKAQAQSGTGDAYVIDTYRSGSNWYRVWSDGFIEQGGYASTTKTTISFNKAFSSSSTVTVVAQIDCKSSNSNAQGMSQVCSVTASSFYMRVSANGSTFNDPCWWYASGY